MYILLGKTYVCSQSRYTVWLTTVMKESIKEATAANRASTVVLYCKRKEVERHELRFRPAREKPVFKLHLQVETWFWKVF
jgi:hypothetical protein